MKQDGQQQQIATSPSSSPHRQAGAESSKGGKGTALRAAMQRLRQKRRGARPTIERQPRSPEGLVLSSTQERLWFIEQLEPGTGAYNIGTAVQLRGRLDRHALHHALLRVIGRHESLRTTFRRSEDAPRQVIHERLDLPLPLIDLQALGSSREELVRWVAEDRRRPFDLERGPLLRAVLLRLDEDDHVLALSLHHLISDGWSTSILVKEWMDFYRAQRLGDAAFRLPEIKLQYADYAVWQRAREAAELDKPLAFWTAHLEGCPEQLEMPFDRPRPTLRSHRGARLNLDMKPRIATSVEDVAQQHQTTPFVVLLLAFKLLLARWSGVNDLVVGMPIANRQRAEWREVVGFFANTLALRLRFEPQSTVADLLSQLHGLVLEAHQHQDLPFEQLVEALQPERASDHTPLFQVVFAFQNVPMPSLELPDLSLEPQSIGAGTSSFDLTLNLEQRDGTIGGWIEYVTRLFDHTTMQRFGRQLIDLLRDLPKNTEVPFEGLAWMDAAQRHQLLVEWQGPWFHDHEAGSGAGPSEAAPSSEDNLATLFIESAARWPERVAVTSGEAQLSFGELDQRSARLAEHLRQVGVGVESRVGIALVRSLELMIGLFATLRIGAAYVPLDVEHPPERLRFVLDDATPQAILTLRLLAPSLPISGENVLAIDSLALGSSESSAVEDVDEVNEVVKGDLHNAYLIYTSGSTGRPKGVMVPHRGVINRLTWQQRRFPLRGRDRVLQKTPFSFDVSVWEMFWPLHQGGTLVMAPPGGHRDPLELTRILIHERIHATHFVPSMLQLFLAQEEATLRALKDGPLTWVLASGEALSDELRRRFYSTIGASLNNLYGPTEASIEVSFWPCPTDPDPLRTSIGRPLSKVQLQVLDRKGRPQPIGVVGELMIGGIAPTRGYHRRPGLTARAFVPDPFTAWEKPGARLYHSGDRARFSADGQIEFLGRLDQQIKIRGFRVELGEIEARLAEHPSIREAAVALRKDATLGERLVAFAVAEPDTELPTLEILRPFLLKSLTDYMLPTDLQWLDALPLGASGKLDRKALQRLQRQRSTKPETDFVEPMGIVEPVIAAIWQQILGLEKISARANFFALGGHSLLAPRLLGQVRDRLRVDLPLRALFNHPTLAGLAALVESELGLSSEDAANGRGPIHEQGPIPVPRDRPVPLSSPQLRFWMRRASEGRSAVSNTPFGARLSGPLDVGALRQALEALFERHEVLRTVVVEVDGEPCQEVIGEAVLPVLEIDLQRLKIEDRESAFDRATGQVFRQPFLVATSLDQRKTAERRPMMRCAIVRLGDAPPENALLVVKDHLITDGWSEGVLARELRELYLARVEQRSPELGELPIQYADYAVWQRADIERRRPGLLAYWRDRLDQGRFPVLRLPADFRAPSPRRLDGDRFACELDAATTQSLLELGRRSGASPFMTLLAAFKFLMRDWTGQSDVALATNIAQRTRAEIEPLIGLFTNVLALRTDLGQGTDFPEVLARVRKTTLEAYAHQDLPFVEILQTLWPGRSQAYNESFPAGFVLQNLPLSPLDWPGIEARLIERPSGVVPRDLILVAAPRGQAMRLMFLYRTDLFTEASIRRLADRFVDLARSFVEQPGIVSSLTERAS